METPEKTRKRRVDALDCGPLDDARLRELIVEIIEDTDASHGMVLVPKTLLTDVVDELVDWGACDEPDCEVCTRALPRLRAALGEAL